MATLYVTEPGSRVEKDHGRLLVTKDDEVLLAAPLAHVTEVVLMGGTGLTTPAMLALLDAGVSVSLVTRQGKLRGRLIAAEARNLPLRHKQYAASSTEKFCREVSRAIVLGKLKNCRTLARRLARTRAAPAEDAGRQTDDGAQQTADGGPPADDHPPSTVSSPDAAALIARLTDAIRQAPAAQSLAELRGLEGSAAKAYFALLRAALRPELTFEKRSRRPPKDAANALLSLAYSLLTNAVFTACEVAGLDPYDGFFHADKYGRPALALDLVEEFRPLVADSVVLTVINNRMLGPEDFETAAEDAGGGVYLSRRGRRKFLHAFSRRLNTEVVHPDAGRALSYQKVFEVQARRLRQCIETGEPNYQPFLAR